MSAATTAPLILLGAHEAREEAAALAVHAAERLQRLALQVLRRPPFGHVAGDRSEAAEVAILVAEGREVHVGEESRAVRADVPALVCDVARGGGVGQQPVGPSLPDVVHGMEGREVPAHDLVGLVSVDLSGARVPAHDRPLRVQHHDRVVVDAFDQEAEALLGVEERRLLLAEARARPRE
jgi:hypothetical protein